MKKLAVVVCGWHYPNYFYKQLPSQDIPDDWEVDYFCVSHRDPSFAVDEKKNIISEFSQIAKLENFSKEIHQIAEDIALAIGCRVISEKS